MFQGVFNTLFSQALETITKSINKHTEENNPGTSNESNESNKSTSFQKILNSYHYEDNSNKTDEVSEVSNEGSSSKSSDLVNLRPEALRRGVHVEVDRLNESIYIDGKRYSPDRLIDMGANRRSRSSWQVPEEIIPENPSGNKAPEDRPTDTILDPTRKFTKDDMTQKQRQAREIYESTRYNLDVLSEREAKERLEQATPGSEEHKAVKNYIKAGQFGWDNPIYSIGDYTRGGTGSDRSNGLNKSV